MSCRKEINPKLVRADLLWFILFNSHESKPIEKWFKSGVSEQRSKNVIKECEERVILQRLVVTVQYVFGPSSQISGQDLCFLTLPLDLMGSCDSKQDVKSFLETTVMKSNY